MKARYTYRFYPTDEQKQQLARTFGCVRYVYNWALAMKTDLYKNQGKQIVHADLSKELTALKTRTEGLFLNEVSRIPLVQGLLQLDKAYTAFFRKTSRLPRFKKRKNQQSATYTRYGFSAKGDGTPVITLTKQKEPLNVVWSRPLPSKPSSLTVIKKPDGRYFVSFVVEINPDPLEKTNQAVGIDLGLKDVVVTSDGWKSGNPKYLQKSLSKLKREQRKLSRKQRGSANWEKQRCKVARLHARIADQRKDFLHKLSTDLVRHYDVVCVEKLYIDGMIANRNLSQSVIDVGWRTFIRLLRYKCFWYSRVFVEADQWFPSTKTCSICGSIEDEIPLNIRCWDCSNCGTNHDRDINAAKNLKAVGMAASACGENVSPSQDDRLISEKQESQ